VHAAFDAAGAAVTDVTCRTAPVDAAATGSTRPRRMAWLSPAARRPLAAAYRGSRTAAGTLAQLPRRLAITRANGSKLASELASAELVIAESAAAAAVAREHGVPRSRLWALALPPGRLFAGDATGYAGELARTAPAVAGFLAGREAERASVERATSGTRTRVELFPPVAADRPCPRCAAQPGAQREPEPPEPVAQLARYRAAPDPAAGDQLRAAGRLLAAGTPQAPARPRPRRSVLVSGYDLKFAGDLAERLDRRTDVDVTVDEWPELWEPSRQTAGRLRAADAVFAEWARTSAVWLSRRARSDQFVAVRLHRFELDSPYPRQIVIDNVGAVVYIAPLFGRRIRDELGWPAEKLVYIPNYLDVDWLDRPKLPEARFAIGFVGIEWSRKRFDRALDLLAAVRREDLRYTLVVRSTMPWQNPYVWADPAERAYAGRCFDRIERDPLLRDAVHFDPPGADMARWYRRVGHFASTSDEEGSHASLAEAMAAGSVPVIRDWPGAAEIYDPEWVHATTDQAVAAVLAGADQPVWAERARRARAEVRRTHDPAAVVAAWADLLHGEVTAARGYFGGPATPDHGPAGRLASPAAP
jgi:glycosyltransferase involved in cell wall biosynthesis